MNRTSLMQETRRMRFVEAHMDWQARRFAQREAALAGSVRSNSLPEQNCSRVHWSGTRSTKARAVTLATHAAGGSDCH